MPEMWPCCHHSCQGILHFLLGNPGAALPDHWWTLASHLTNKRNCGCDVAPRAQHACRNAFGCLNWVADMKSKAQLGQLATVPIVQLWVYCVKAAGYALQARHTDKNKDMG